VLGIGANRSTAIVSMEELETRHTMVVEVTCSRGKARSNNSVSNITVLSSSRGR
jgi:hypothetical protein